MMDFFINHIGWFVGIFFIGLFAVVGYYADKKEQTEKKEQSSAINKEQENNSNNNVKTYSNNSDQGSNENINDSVLENYVINDNIVTEKTENLPDFGDNFIYTESPKENEKENIDYSINVDGTNNTNESQSDLSGLEWDGSSETENINTNLETINELQIQNNTTPNDFENVQAINNTTIDNNETKDTVAQTINDTNTTIDNTIENNQQNTIQEFNDSNINNNINENNANYMLTPENTITENVSAFEEVNMTLDDLEKSNIDITNDSLGVTTSDEGLIEDYDDEYEENEQQNINEINNTQFNSNEANDIYNVETEQENESNTEQESNINNVFETEIENDTNNNEDKEKKEIIDNIVFQDDVQESVPEFENNNSIDLYDDSISDDIWKF